MKVWNMYNLHNYNKTFVVLQMCRPPDSGCHFAIKWSKVTATRPINSQVWTGFHQATKIKFPDISRRFQAGFWKFQTVRVAFITLVVGSNSPTPTPCHHLSMQVSVLLDIFSTYNLKKNPWQTAKFPDIPVKTEFPDFPQSGNPVYSLIPGRTWGTQQHGTSRTQRREPTIPSYSANWEFCATSLVASSQVYCG